MPHPIIVPVVAHRMFGRRFVPVGTRTSGRRTPGGPFGLGVPLGPEVILEEVVDTDHGTRRSVEEIERLFHEGATPHFTRGFSVNLLWRPADVQFVLVGIVDETVDSHYADYLGSDSRFWPDLSRWHDDSALNMYFFRRLAGGWGFAKRGRAFVSDRWDPAIGGVKHEDVWKRDVITASHEIGHVFDLGHRGDRDNIMTGGGTGPTSKGLTDGQALFARQRARNFRRPWYRNLPDDDDVRTASIDVPHVAAYAGETLPPFD